ncbi:MAG: alpha/beta hydrolase [Rhodospirillaceae bacterium]
MADSTPAGILPRGDGAAIAYRQTPGAAPGVVFLPGFRSDMSGSKALALEAHCVARGQAFLRFDYQGHGESTGRFEDGTIGQWAADAAAAVTRLTEGPQILVGSSMGGWIMLLVARAHPKRVAGLVGIAAAPDFTEDLIWERMDEAQRATLMSAGVIHAPSQYDPVPTPISRALVEDGRRHLLLRRPITVHCPVRLLHGMRDPDVPFARALQLADALLSADVEVRLIKDGDHRLSRPQDLAILCATVDGLAGHP